MVDTDFPKNNRFQEFIRKKKTNFGHWTTDVKNDPISWAIIIGITVVFITFLIVPLIFVLINAVYYNGKLSMDAINDVFGSKLFWDPGREREDFMFRAVYDPDTGITTNFIRGPDMGIFLNTIVIGLLTTVLSLILGLITAVVMAKLDFPGKTIISGFLLIPLVLPPFVSGVGFHAIAGAEGMLNTYIFEPYFSRRIVFEGVVAIVIVQSLHYFTLIYLN